MKISGAPGTDPYVLIRQISIGNIDAETSIVVVRRNKAGTVRAVSAGDCFAVKVDGRELLPQSGAVRGLFEYDAKGGDKSTKVGFGRNPN